MREAMLYYAGLPSWPRLVFRTGTAQWKQAPRWTEEKWLKPVYAHQIIAAWKTLAPKVIAYLDSVRVMWTSIDGVRFAVVDPETIAEAPDGPVVLWIGVMPGSLSGEDACIAAHGCRALLREFDITDVDVEIRESVFTRKGESDPTPDPFKGLQLAGVNAPKVQPYLGGTGGIYVSDGEGGDKIFLVTVHGISFSQSAVAVGAGCHDEDYSMIEIDSSKMDKTAFRGNVMDLRESPPAHGIFQRYRIQSTSKYTYDNLLELRGVIPEAELLRPSERDPNDTDSLLVIKNGAATGVTAGRANGMPSVVRQYMPDGTMRTSMAWAILPFDEKSRAFAAAGDAGAVIADGQGRVGGLLIGGAASKGEAYDITYATPVARVFERMRENGFGPGLGLPAIIRGILK